MTTATYTHPNPHTTGETELAARSGQRVDVRPMDPTKYDEPEVGPMYVIVFADGYTGEAFEDELSDVDGGLPS